MNGKPQELSLHYLWIMFAVIPPVSIAIIIFAWVGMVEKEYTAALFFSLVIGAFLFLGMGAFSFGLLGMRFVFYPTKLEAFRFKKRLYQIAKADIAAVYSIGNKDGFMIETKDKSRYRIHIPSGTLRRQFDEQLKTLADSEGCQRPS